MSPVSRLNRWAHPPLGEIKTLNNDQDSVPISVRASSHWRGASQCGKPLNEGVGAKLLEALGSVESCSGLQDCKHFLSHLGGMNRMHAPEIHWALPPETRRAWSLAEDQPMPFIAGQAGSG